ncbi:hypothetical protein AB7Y24_17900, partial [Escherichia coli]
KIGPDPRNFNQRVCLGRNDLLIRTFLRTIGIGAGCFCDLIQYMEYQADYYITINDSIKTWVQTQYSKDSGLPMAVIGYSVAEEAGMRRLASYLDLHSGYPCIHFTAGCDYDWIE